ncbi:MAG: UDP-N-acetylmuramoyl-tripeptide--D-alanyl-D-alanine ligase [Holosporales bacterium]|jgi:UDP-N-acetylmuramoyl-tripeptide--D-alanyl-D-alanine ligase|nr:UDP-N-acetylmuramoyl-tripeptide--D-alanyl-D-alanine ligase [Holosporales bacterium]
MNSNQSVKKSLEDEICASSRFWTVNDIVSALNFFSIPYDAQISGFSIDSRTIQKGECFVAIKGENFDGHDFIEESFKKGASLCIVENSDLPFLKKYNHLVVDDTQKALSDLALYTRNNTEATIIGISGSVGKTTVRTWVSEILSLVGETVSSKKNYNGRIGLPLSMLSLKKDSQFGVFEIGIDRQGTMQHFAKICQPNVAVITAIAPSHIEFFNSIDSLAAEKADLLSGLCSGGAAVINHEIFKKFPIFQQKIKEWYSENGVNNYLDIPTVGVTSEATAYIVSANSDFQKGQTKIYAKLAGVDVCYTIHAIGNSKILNSLIALVTAITSLYNENFGVIMREKWNNISDSLLKGMENLRVLPGRGRLFNVCIKNCQEVTIIDDSYNANPTSMKAGIEDLCSYISAKRRIAVIGGMLELGNISEKEHFYIFNLLNNTKVDKVYAVGDLTKSGFETLSSSKKGAWTKSPDEMSKILKDEIKSKDIILIKGSFSMKLWKIVKKFENSCISQPILKEKIA